MRCHLVATDGAMVVPTAPGLGFAFDPTQILHREELFAQDHRP